MYKMEVRLRALTPEDLISRDDWTGQTWYYNPRDCSHGETICILCIGQWFNDWEIRVDGERMHEVQLDWADPEQGDKT